MPGGGTLPRKIAAIAVLALLAGPGRAAAQPRSTISEDEGDGFAEVLVRFITSLGDKTRDEFFQFFETIELLDVEAEIDRLVGSPWELNDSTAYKLSLLPLHIRYPTYQQLARQMTRLDDLRSRRIQNVTPDSVELIALRFESLSADHFQDEVLAALGRHFSPREVVDLGVFALSHQSFFPDTEESWQHHKRRIAAGGPPLAASIIATGAAFDAGAFSQSGTLRRWPGHNLRLGWFGGFRRLGFRLRPQLRAGLTAHVPGLEMAAGLTERIRPEPQDRQRSVEVALREGWLSRLARSSGWDAFFEGALRRVLAAPGPYTGEVTTGRVGVFARREEVPWLRNVVLRSSAEMESDFEDEIRFALGVGFEHTPSGLATVMQSSQSAIQQGDTRMVETRTGLFLAGTTEPPTQIFIDAMHFGARLVRDEWEAIAALERRIADARLTGLGTAPLAAGAELAAFAALGRDTATIELHVARLAELLPEYLESRRLAYSVLRRTRFPDDLHGPLDGAVLNGARGLILARLTELARLLEESSRTLGPLHARFLELREIIPRVEREGPGTALVAGYRDELEAIDQAWRRESERVSAALEAYHLFSDSVRRMAVAAGRLVPAQEPDPLSLAAARRLAARAAVPLR